MNGRRTFIINSHWDFPHKNKQQVGEKKEENKILSKKGSLQGVHVDFMLMGEIKPLI